MLLSFRIQNLFSFKELVEFNMIPSRRISRLPHHKYMKGPIEGLKLAALYGANGAGKSNFIKAISALQQFVKDGDIPPIIIRERFKLTTNNINQLTLLGISFCHEGRIFDYEFKSVGAIIINETLSSSGDSDGLNMKLLFSRDENEVNFYEGFESTEKNRIYGEMISKALFKKNFSVLNILASVNYEGFSNMKPAFDWISRKLMVINTSTSLKNLPHIFDINKDLSLFAKEIFDYFGTGISDFYVDKKPIDDLIKGDSQYKQNIISDLLARPDATAKLSPDTIVVNESGQIITKKLMLGHKNDMGTIVHFNLSEESDGTKRILEYIPALSELIYSDVTYIIDEIERSIHALTIKAIISKFSSSNTRGQLIFSTHESNLLDQEIFRPDEIWFIQKSSENSASNMYSLISYKEHHTIDIQKGYLRGKYGAIPFLANTNDLNWNKYSEDSQ